MSKYLNIINEAFNRPVLLEPGYAGFFYAYLANRMGADALNLDGEWLNAEAMAAKAASYQARDGDHESSDDKRRSYSIDQGVAIIPVEGTLMHKAGWLDSMSGAASYASLRKMTKEAEADVEVDGLFFDFDSPGGAVSGCFDFCDFVAGLSKPTASFVNELAASAAYAIASSTGKIYVPRTGQVGSVGVIWAHRDRTDGEGSKSVTLVYSGKHKADGNPYGPLPDDVRADVQADLDGMRQIFAQTVANGRGISLESVLDTEARMYTGQVAVDVGFADAVMSKDAAFDDFISSLSGTGSFNSTGASISMSVEKDDARASSSVVSDGQPAATATVPPADVQSPQVEALISAAVSAEQQRIFGIIGHESAVGRMATAIQMAQAGMEVGAATTILATIPKAEPEPAGQVAAQNNQALQMMSAADVVDPETETEAGAGANTPAPKLIA